MREAAARARARCAELSQLVLRAELPKPQRVRLGDWEARSLTLEQMRYAALDAFAALILWHALAELPQRGQLLRDEMRARAAVAAEATAMTGAERRL